ncbi:MAG TPA: hypothetical protein PKE27_09365 [Povalibacter sp.]|uniref:hypothetical protein n=1 Tax=Povalibacter sp. TaxID=1962978 RepID=UPI002C38311D|nr:hypothetical protein [Povalibacter sp.]HMN44769.1 hypothetical protein [Povalibacter sp.]
MKIRTMTTAALAAILVFSVAQARDTRLKLPLKDALETVDARDKLGTDVKFFFGSQATPAVVQKLGTYTSNKKTNFANKSDKEGCEWAFLSAMISLKERALAEGGNAVINIESYYKKNQFSSETEYECGAGAIIGGVALRGTVVKL